MTDNEFLIQNISQADKIFLFFLLIILIIFIRICYKYIKKNSVCIIRIEHEDDGLGIFHSKAMDTYEEPSLANLVSRHFDGPDSTEYNFPSPQEDGVDINLKKKEWFCAFKGINQLFSYIKEEEVDILISKGFKILFLSVTEYQEGKHQFLYTKESIVDSIDITNDISAL